MKLSELINKQTKWEYDRGIVNGNHGIDRIQVELDEARDEPDLHKRLIEMADVIIIATGSVGALLTELDLTAQDFESLLMAKMAQNNRKYPVQVFQNMSPDEAIQYCRDRWGG